MVDTTTLMFSYASSSYTVHHLLTLSECFLPRDVSLVSLRRAQVEILTKNRKPHVESVTSLLWRHRVTWRHREGYHSL